MRNTRAERSGRSNAGAIVETGRAVHAESARANIDHNHATDARVPDLGGIFRAGMSDAPKKNEPPRNRSRTWTSSFDLMSTASIR